jgi:hypothetical protein
MLLIYRHFLEMWVMGCTREAIKSAEVLYQHLEKAIERLQSYVDQQVAGK